MIPGAAVYALMGSGLNKTLVAGEGFDDIPNISFEFLCRPCWVGNIIFNSHLNKTMEK